LGGALSQSVLSRAEPTERFTVEHFEWWIDHCGLRLEDQAEGELWPLEDFQREIVSDVFGVPAGGEVWVVIPEGNAKTTLTAGIALYHLQHTPSPWVPIGAASREQAEIMFSQAAGFVERAKPFVRGQSIKDSNGLFQVQKGHRRILSVATVAPA
jgi:phage terminase large subunit-like protein